MSLFPCIGPGWTLCDQRVPAEGRVLVFPLSDPAGQLFIELEVLAQGLRPVPVPVPDSWRREKRYEARVVDACLDGYSELLASPTGLIAVIEIVAYLSVQDSISESQTSESPRAFSTLCSRNVHSAVLLDFFC